MMKKLLYCLLILLIPSMIFASSFPQSVAFEFQEHGKFSGVIGKAYISETAVEIVAFAEKDGMVVPFAFIDTDWKNGARLGGSIASNAEISWVSCQQEHLICAIH